MEINECWESDMKFIGSCGMLPKNFNIHFSSKTQAKIDILMKEKDGIEWLCFLVGEVNWKDNKAIVHDLFIPDKQDIGVAHVDEIDVGDESIRKSFIGVIHSHHTMGAFFSQDDWEFLNKNHDISIVVSTTGYKSVVRFKTKCGSYTHVEGNILNYISLDEEEKEDFIKEVRSKICSMRKVELPFPYIGDYSVFDEIRKQKEEQGEYNKTLPNGERKLMNIADFSNDYMGE